MESNNPGNIYSIFKHLTNLVNSVGLLDFDYRGEAMIKLMSFNAYPPEITRGQAIAQVAIIETPRIFFEIVDELSDTKRGSKGFGSTDIRM